VVSEPVGIRHIRIVRENLAIDLRPASRNEKATVEATYQLHNDGPQQSLELLFASGSADVSGFEAVFDGQPVQARPVSGATIPESWKPPKQTPGFGEGRKIDYAPGSRDFHAVKTVGFSLAVAPGPHTLTVRYSAAVGTNWLGHPTIYRQFAYVLAPARAWESFGGLDVTVQLPVGWAAVVRPDLEREGDTLHGTFSRLPADALAITFQAPEGPWFRPLIVVTQSVFAIVGICGVIAAWAVGRWRGRRAARAVTAHESHIPRIWPWAIGIGCLWSLGVFATGLLAIYGPETTLPEGQVVHYGYAHLFEAIGLMLLTPPVLVVGFLIAYVTGVVVRRKNLPASPSAG
jgi:hypothetical protein